jgi:hypothetical protein
MDIMNNMTVSTSKLTFSLIAIAALLIGGSGFVSQEAHATVPVFTAIHNTTTTTEVTFATAVNGTLRSDNWFVNGVVVTGVTNGTTPSASNIATTAILTGTATSLGFLNDTTTLKLTHAAIADGDTFVVTYSGAFGGANTGGNLHDGSKLQSAYGVAGHPMANGTVSTGVDQNEPNVVTAYTTGPKSIKISTSEPMANINATGATFTLVGANEVIGAVAAYNGTNFIFLTLQNPIDFRDTFTLSYTRGTTWITDATNTPLYADDQGRESHGNRLADFTGLVVTNYEGQLVDNCADCQSPEIRLVQIGVNSDSLIPVSTDNPIHINAEVGDVISYEITIDDNKGASNIPFVGLYTNFGASDFDNLFYTNNFDSGLDMSANYYEWNVRSDNVNYDGSGSLTINDPTLTVDNLTDSTTVTYSMTIKDSMESSQIWIDASDISGNYLKAALPITLEVSGPASLTFANDNQKLVSYFNESVLFAMVSQWTTMSSDDASNVEQLSSMLGIENQLPTWTTELASWVADDKIDVADMIVAVEYVINL